MAGVVTSRTIVCDYSNGDNSNVFFQAEQGKLEFEDKIASLKMEKNRLQNELQQLKQSYDILDRRTAELKATEEKRHQQDLQALQRKNAELKVSLSCFIITFV